MSIWFIIAYVILGIVALGIIGYAFVVNILERRIGEDFMDKKNDEACNEVFKDLDPKIEVMQKKIGVPRIVLYLISTFLCWPISTPYMLYKIHKYGDYLEDYIQYNGQE